MTDNAPAQQGEALQWEAQQWEAQQWEAAAAAVLRKARRLKPDDPDDRAVAALTRRTVEGLDIPPLGTSSGSTGLSPTGLPGQPPFTRGASSLPGAMGWDIRSLMTDPDTGTAAAAALADLENGATSLWWTVGGPGTPIDELAAGLDGVYLDLAPVILEPAGTVTELAAATAFAEILRTAAVVPAAGTSFGADPIGRAFRSGSEVSPDLTDAVPELFGLATDLGGGALVADGTVAHDPGAGDAAEIGYTLAVAVAYLRAAEQAGLDLGSAVDAVEFRYAATDDQFVTIAKFRAARSVWSRVCELIGVAGVSSGASRAQRQHAVTSRPMMTRYDPWNNLLRTTIGAFAAGVGGAQAVTVLPFDTALGVPDALGRRLSRNISSLLIAESHVAAVVDPAGGSYAVEVLTAELADAAWEEFSRLEEAGGIVAALANGSLQQRISVTVAERRRRIDTRRTPITGVTEFPNLAEQLPTRRSWPTPPTDVGWAAPFEALRDRPTAPVFVATLGRAAQYAARAGFAVNALATGGVRTMEAGPTVDATDVVNAYRVASTVQSLPVVCLAGTDAAYADRGAAVTAGLRDAGAHWIVLAGKPGNLDTHNPDTHTLDTHDFDDYISAGDDVLAFLERTRSHLEPAVAN